MLSLQPGGSDISPFKASRCQMNAKRTGHTLSVGAVAGSIQQRSAEDSGICSANLVVFLQLLSVLEKKLDSEGMLRVPGSQSRIKV